MRAVVAATVASGARWLATTRTLTLRAVPPTPGTPPPPQEVEHKKKTKVLIIAGPTGVGKSTLGAALCGDVDGEIVSADSVQLYRGLDVGSNKPDAATRRNIKHHLVDVADAYDPWSAGRWRRTAVAAIDACARRGKVPVVVGGTMMYVRWLVRGAPDAPAASAAIVERAEEVLREARRAGDWDEGVRVVSALSDRSRRRADKLSRNDWYRLSRALEIGLAETEDKEPLIFPTKTSEPCLADASVYDARCFFLAPYTEPSREHF